VEGLGDTRAASLNGVFRDHRGSGSCCQQQPHRLLVASDAEVDRITEIALSAGVADLNGPKQMPYSPGYYASFFADPSGNRLEVYVRPE